MTTLTVPVTDVTSDPFWHEAREGRLFIQRCPVTGYYQWYPRAHSIHALDVSPEWVESTGKGTVYSYTTIYRGNGPIEAPYTCALILLEEGVLMLSHIVGVEEDHLRVGMPVRVAFRALTDTITLPVFEPLENVE